MDRRSDIFSFGAVLYEMLTGKRAFAGATTPDVLEAVVKNDPDWSALPAGTPAYLRRLLERMLAKDRKQRLQAIGEARIALENPVEQAFDLPVSEPRPQGAVSALAAIAALAILALAALAFLHFREPPPAPREVRVLAAGKGRRLHKTKARLRCRPTAAASRSSLPWMENACCGYATWIRLRAGCCRARRMPSRLFGPLIAAK